MPSNEHQPPRRVDMVEDGRKRGHLFFIDVDSGDILIDLDVRDQEKDLSSPEVGDALIALVESLGYTLAG